MNSQRFRIVQNANGSYRLQSYASNYTKAVVVKNGSTAEGWGIVQFTDNGSTNGHWYFEQVRPITLAHTSSATILAGRSYWYTFTPAESGLYIFTTTGSTDTYGELYQGSSLLASDDDSGAGNNFSITHRLNAGTEYRLKVRGYSSTTTGSYLLKVVKEKKAIIILPGIMGSELFAGSQLDSFSVGTKLWDPTADLDANKKIQKLVCDTNGNSIYNIFAGNQNYGAQGTYKKLYNQLKQYYSGQYDIVFFPYDWRLSCTDSANALDSFIDGEDYTNVILVAHSMGGIVASKYLAKGTDQQDTVDKLITLGTPFLGAPQAINAYVNGLDFGMAASLIGVNSTIKTIIPNLKSIYELFPTKKWFDLTNQTLCTYKYINVGSSPTGPYVAQTYADTKTYLYNTLNGGGQKPLLTSAESMHDTLFIGSRHITSYVDSYYIVGTNLSTDKSVENAIISYGNYSASTEFTKTNCGDGTVPTWSADLGGTNQNKTFYAVNRDHTGALNNDGTVKSEGLVVSDNIITKIKQIIDGNPNGSATGITTTRPVYASNGWTQGVNDEYTSLTFICLISDIFSATYLIIVESFLFPLLGTGAR